jgi:hypothetical protein
VTQTYQQQVHNTTQTKQWLTWLPTFGWLPFALAINSFIIPPGTAVAYWGRWIGFIFLLIYGFNKVFISGKWQCNNFDRFAFLVFTVIIISTAYADLNGVLYAADFYKTGIFKAVSFLLAYLSLTWGVQSVLNSFHDATAIIKNLVCSATVIYTIGLIGNALRIIPVLMGAPSGIFFNPNATAALGIVILPLSIWFSSRQKNWGIFRFFPTLIIFTAIILSGARTPLLTLIILLLYYLICWSRYKGTEMLMIYGVATIAISALLILSIDFWESSLFEKLYESLTTSTGAGITSYRTNLLWPLFIEKILSSPISILIGNGWGSEEALLLHKSAQSIFFERLWVGTAHNAYIGLTYQIGLIGSLLTFVPLWSIVINQIKESANYINKEHFELKLALCSALLAELCLCVFESGFYNIGSAHSLPGWLVAYMAVKLPYLPTDFNN